VQLLGHRDGVFVIGSAGPMDAAGNHAALVDAFLRLIASPHPAHGRLRLMIAGDGPARAGCLAALQRAGAADRAWLPGACRSAAIAARDGCVCVTLFAGNHA
jgi:hypothetical protein